MFIAGLNLTLTSVVFELQELLRQIRDNKFNFNKCCIWIEKLSAMSDTTD